MSFKRPTDHHVVMHVWLACYVRTVIPGTQRCENSGLLVGGVGVRGGGGGLNQFKFEKCNQPTVNATSLPFTATSK